MFFRRSASCTGQRTASGTLCPMVYESPRARNLTGLSTNTCCAKTLFAIIKSKANIPLLKICFIHALQQTVQRKVIRFEQIHTSNEQPSHRDKPSGLPNPWPDDEVVPVFQYYSKFNHPCQLKLSFPSLTKRRGIFRSRDCLSGTNVFFC